MLFFLKIYSYVIISFPVNEAEKGELVSPGTYPQMCIWINTDAGDYFLENNPKLYEEPADTSFLYDFYDITGYLKKYGSK